MGDILSKKTGSAWLQLLRAPNLLTVPGDPWAGFLLSTHGGPLRWVALCAIAASLCFYCAGLLLNDLVDRERDRRERPARPLPSGRISPRAAWAVFCVFSLLALACSFLAGLRAFYVGLSLFAAILSYNLLLKGLPWIGPLNMGLCRGLNVLLGAATDLFTPVFSLPVLLVFGITVLFVAAVTQLARYEMEPRKISGRIRAFPSGILAAGLVVFLKAHPFPSLWANLVFTATFFLALFLNLTASINIAIGVVLDARKKADPEFGRWMNTSGKEYLLPEAIGLMLGSLLLVQSSFTFAAGGTVGFVSGLTLLALWPLNRIISRKFYAS